jgi:hypothetical protein
VLALRQRATPALEWVAGVANGVLGNAEPVRDAGARVLGKLTALPHDRARLPTLVIAAELSYLGESRPLADALAPELASLGGRYPVTGTAAVYLGSVSHAPPLRWTGSRRR